MSLLLKGARIVGGIAGSAAGSIAGSDVGSNASSGVDRAPVDILLKHGVITGIGTGFTGTATIDLDGRYVMPGLWDGHVHLTQTALTRRRVDLTAASSATDAAAMMAAAERPAEVLPLIGFGFRDGMWAAPPTKHDLDAVVADIPVVVLSGDLHCAWLNSAALAAFGMAGHPTGVLREDDAFKVTTAAQTVPADVLDMWVAAAATDAARRGVVGVVDLEMADTVQDWTRRFAAGFRGLRIEAGVYTPWLDSAIEAGLRTGQVIEGTDGLLSVGPFKIITDGSLNTRTAFCGEPYEGLVGADARGQLNLPTAELVALMRRASEAGLAPALHAIGDEANRLALDSFAAAGCHGRIEHAQLVREVDYARFAGLGVAASVQPEHAMDDRDMAERYWPGRTDRAFALRSLLDAGAELILGSDAPVAPLDPWVTIAAAVGRTRDGREPWHPEQRITIAQALAASTNGVQRVVVGNVADLAILDIDPLAATPDQLRVMPVAATLLAGYFTHNEL